MKDGKYHPIEDFVALAVPLRICLMQQAGGPTNEDIQRMQRFGPVVGEHGDVLLYGGKKGEAAVLATELVHAIAVLSFTPGGIEMFGHHFEAQATITVCLNCRRLWDGQSEVCPTCGGNPRTGQPGPNMPAGVTLKEAQEELTAMYAAFERNTKGNPVWDPQAGGGS